MLAVTKNKTKVFLIAECGDQIISIVSITLGPRRKNHIGTLAISIRDGYRGLGLGAHLMSEIIALAKKDLKPNLKIIQLEVYANNKPAIGLYEKLGFKTVAMLPRQIQYKGELIDELIMILEI